MVRLFFLPPLEVLQGWRLQWGQAPLPLYHPEAESGLRQKTLALPLLLPEKISGFPPSLSGLLFEHPGAGPGHQS